MRSLSWQADMETLASSSFPTHSPVKYFNGSSSSSSFVCRTQPHSFGFSFKTPTLLRAHRGVKVHAIDAAQLFDYEARQLQELEMQKKLKVGIVGFGNYGQFLARRIASQGHTVLAYSRSDYTELARRLNVQYFRDADDFCEEHPEVIILCSSILSTESVLQALPVQRLRRNTLFVDVLSVKVFPRNLLLQMLPAEFDILCTHPMFGPQSGKGSWESLPFVYDKVRVGKGNRDDRCEKFLDIFRNEGCRMVEMSCEEHDRYAASSQFITHTVGRVLGKLGLNSTPINTKGYETLLELVNNTAGDSFDLYYGLFMYNINATEELDRLELAFDSVKKQLFSQLHNILRGQLFDQGPESHLTQTQTPTRLQISENSEMFKTTMNTEIPSRELPFPMLALDNARNGSAAQSINHVP